MRLRGHSPCAFQLPERAHAPARSICAALREQQRDGEVGDVVVEHVGGVGDADAALARRIGVDGVVSDPEIRHHGEIGKLRHLGRAEGVVPLVGHRRDRLADLRIEPGDLLGPVKDLRIERLPEQRDLRLGVWADGQHRRHGVSSLPDPARRASARAGAPSRRRAQGLLPSSSWMAASQPSVSSVRPSGLYSAPIGLVQPTLRTSAKMWA